jgi:hypothetical protein
VEAQEEMINMLKLENDKLKIDVVNTCSMLELMIADNNKLRVHVQSKTEDFKNILTLTSNDFWFLSIRKKN